MESFVSVGIDIGKLIDPTTVVTCEVQMVNRGRTKTRLVRRVFHSVTRTQSKHEEIEEAVPEEEYVIRHIERLPLNTDYIQVASRLVQILTHERVRTKSPCVYMDVTGVGGAIYDMIVDKLSVHLDAWSLELHPVTITGGDHPYDIGTGHVGKIWLVSNLNALLMQKKIQGGASHELRQLMDELLVYERRVSQDGAMSLGAMRTGTHDDLATSLALATLAKQSGGSLEFLDPEIATALQNFLG